MPIPFNPDDLAASIDASIIDAALAAVEKRSKKPSVSQNEETLGVDLELDLGDGSAGGDDEEFTVEPLPAQLQGSDLPRVNPPHADPPKAEPARQEPVRAEVSAGEKAWMEERKRWLERQLDSSEKLKKQDQELKKLRAERESLAEQLAAAQKTLQERTAEFENTRQRHRKDRDEAERVAEERSIRPMLDIVDNLDRAMGHAAADPTKVMSGLNMIVEQFRNHLKKVGAERILASPGSPFDPEVHEAVLNLPTAEYPPGTIVSEVSAGFRLKGRLLRAARVVVATPVSG